MPLPNPRVEARLYEAGQAAGLLCKAAGDAQPTYALKGRLVLSSSGWLLLSVPNSLVRGIFSALHVPGVELPLRNGQLNAHVTVMTGDEVAKIGAEKITERGRNFAYQLGPLQQVVPNRWKGVSRVYFIKVLSPELRLLRSSYGLTPLPHGTHDFHITVGIRRTGVVGNNEISKAAGHEAMSEVPGDEAGGRLLGPQEFVGWLGGLVPDVPRAGRDAPAKAASCGEVLPGLQGDQVDLGVLAAARPPEFGLLALQGVQAGQGGGLGPEKQGHAGVQGEGGGLFGSGALAALRALSGSGEAVRGLGGQEGRQVPVSSDAAWRGIGEGGGTKTASGETRGPRGVHEGDGVGDPAGVRGSLLPHRGDERGPQGADRQEPARGSHRPAAHGSAPDHPQRVPAVDRGQLAQGAQILGLLHAGTTQGDPRVAAAGRQAARGDVLPRATLRTSAVHDDVCPHCGEVMSEKACVPNWDHDTGTLRPGYRHRGPCYDKGPFELAERPKAAGLRPELATIVERNWERDEPALRYLAKSAETPAALRSRLIAESWFEAAFGKLSDVDARGEPCPDGECCPKCHARLERGDDGACNRCGGAWPKEAAACTCSYPEPTYRNGSGHATTCPVHVAHMAKKGLTWSPADNAWVKAAAAAPHRPANTCTFKGKTLDIDHLERLTAGRPVEEIPLGDLQKPNRSSQTGYSQKRLAHVDMKKPILVGEDGTLFDGRHRLCRHLDEGKPHIRARRVTADDLAACALKPDPIDRSRVGLLPEKLALALGLAPATAAAPPRPPAPPRPAPRPPAPPPAALAGIPLGNPTTQQGGDRASGLGKLAGGGYD